MFHIPNAFLRPLFLANGQLRHIISPAPKKVEDVEISPFWNNAPCAASVSADFELGWAWRNLDKHSLMQRANTERENVPRLLQMLSEHHIPITWATVGHLFLESCQRDPHGLAHPEMLRPSANFGWDGDWYQHDPCSDAKSAPAWYCPDLIRQICNATPHHELGTHSFSHIDFGPGASNSALVRQEIESCISAMAPFGVQPRSLIYCFNHMGHQHLPLFGDLGITSVRHRDPHCRIAYPERSLRGVYKIYESMNLRTTQRYDYVSKATVFLGEAELHQGAFHIWFHPSDPWPIFETIFDPILRRLDQLRRENRVWIATMQDLVGYCEARATTDLVIARSQGRTKIHLNRQMDAQRYGKPELTLCIPMPFRPWAICQIDPSSGSKIPLPEESWRMSAGRLVVNVPWTCESLEIIH